MSRRLVVILEGLQGTEIFPGSIIGQAIKEYLGPGNEIMRLGDPYGSFCEKPQFNPRHIVVTGLTEIFEKKADERRTDRVTIIGSSLGALLGYDLIKAAQELIEKNEYCGAPAFDMVLINAPTGLRDLCNQNARLAKFTPAINLPLRLNQRILAGSLPETESLSAEAKKEWREHMARSASFPFKVWVKQLRYLASHKGPEARVLAGIPLVALRSEHDEYVRTDWPEHWGQAGDLWGSFVARELAHASFLEFPTAWAGYIIQAFRVLDGRL